jgi:hypothetical protein
MKTKQSLVRERRKRERYRKREKGRVKKNDGKG